MPPSSLQHCALPFPYIPSDQMMSVIPALQTPIHPQKMNMIDPAQSPRVGIHTSIAALVQNQVDSILQLSKPHLARFVDWKHEDHRKRYAKPRMARKKVLLQQYPGLLSGPQAVHLQADDWTPRYIISASIPASNLDTTALGTDLEVCNVIWQFKTSKGPLALTLYINHAHPTPSHKPTSIGHSPSYSPSRILVGQKGLRFIHASYSLMDILRKEPMPAASNKSDTAKTFGIGLRVGHTVGEFHWQPGSESGCPDLLVLKEEDLTPYSLKNLESRPEFTFPYDTDANRTLGAKKKTRVQAIYWHRFQYKMSEKMDGETAVPVTEPGQERSFAQADEELITIRGLNGTLTPEYLFSGIYTIFPPQKEWSIPFPSRASPVVSYFMPDSEDSTGARRDSLASIGDNDQDQFATAGRFYFKDRLVSTNPTGFSRVGINYFGALETSESSGLDVQVTGASFKEFRHHVFRTVDMGIQKLPELAVELAIDILTDASALPDDCAPTLTSPRGDDAQSGTVEHAYRTAFEAAWRRLEPNLAEDQEGIYPYVASLSSAEEDKALIQDLRMHPTAIHPRVRLLLAKSGAYPPVKDYAESLLLSAPGAAHLLPGVDILKAALPRLLPSADIAGDPLSIRKYAHSYPRVVWDPSTRVFIMASSLGARRCPAHQGATNPPSEADEPQTSQQRPTSQCLCWIGLALQAAASSWQSKNGGTQFRPGFDEEFFHILLDCYQTAFPALRTTGIAAGPERGGKQESWRADEDDDDVFSYCDDTSIRSTDTSSQNLAQSAPSGKAALTFSSAGSSESIVPYPSPVSSVPLPRRQLVMQTRAVQHQGSSQQTSISPMKLAAQKPLGHRGSEKVPKDMAEILQVLTKHSQGMVGVTQALELYMLEWERESSALREELAQEHARHAALDAAFTTYRLENEAALAAKNATLAANSEAMEQKDVQISQLEESVHTLTARVQEQAAAAESQAVIFRDQTGRIQELREREVRWAAHMKEMLAEASGPSSPRVRNDIGCDEDEVGSHRKKKRLS